jgi:phosphohistidine phosphatase SixA
VYAKTRIVRIGLPHGIRVPKVSGRLMMRQFSRFALVVLAISLIAMPAAAADDSQEAWAALAQGGHVALIRHGNAPPGYGGDPPGFRMDDCSTQRNLDDKGRAQASALGEAFRNHGVRVDRIASSPVCRCMDTASLMAVGKVESSWALVPDKDPNAGVRLRELKEMVGNWRGPGTLVLVTHGFTIRPLIGIIPDQAEVVVLRPTPGIEPGARVVGRIAAPR